VKYTAFILAMLTIMTGCAAPNKVEFHDRKVTSTDFEVIDIRPYEQLLTRKSENENGTVTILGDDSITPKPILLLQTHLAKRFGTSIDKADVQLDAFTVEIKEPGVSVDMDGFDVAMQSTPGANPATGALALMLIRGIETLKTKKTLKVFISGFFNGKEFAGIHIEKSSGSITSSDIQNAIDLALEDASLEIEELIKENQKTN
jgi:hypothetical protein